MKRLFFSTLFILTYVATTMASFSISGVKFTADSASEESGIDTIMVVKSTEDAYLTYKSDEKFNFKWFSFDIDGNKSELKTEEEATDTTSVKLKDVASSGYLLQFDDDNSESVWVFRCKDFIPKMDTLIVHTSIEDQCDYAQLQIYPDEESAPAMVYKGLSEEDEMSVMPQILTLKYDSTYYTDKEFVTEEKEYELPAIDKLEDVIDHTIKAPLDTTRFVVFANQYARKLEEADSVKSELFKPLAVESHVFASVRIREEATNENDKGDPEEPTEAKIGEPLQLKGSSPVNFEALNYSSAAAYHYIWSLSKSKEYSPLILKSHDRDFRYTFTEQGTYYLKVEVSNDAVSEDYQEGCTQVREFQIEVRESQLDVPNVFTPNGDGVNDLFKVAYRSIIEFHGWVYNQWGGLVYQWVDPSQGWDGTINGKPAADGAYMYIIEATGSDYDSDGKRVKYLKRGSVSIIR